MPVKEAGGKAVKPGEARTTDVFGVRVDILLTGEDTDGVFSQYEVIAPPGEGPPPHAHDREHETFFVMEGEFEFLCGDRVTRGGPGTLVSLPRQVPHTFRNVGSTTGRLLGTASPAGHERFFEEVDALAREGRLTPDAGVAVCERHGMRVLVPNGADGG